MLTHLNEHREFGCFWRWVKRDEVVKRRMEGHFSCKNGVKIEILQIYGKWQLRIQTCLVHSLHTSRLFTVACYGKCLHLLNPKYITTLLRLYQKKLHLKGVLLKILLRFRRVLFTLKKISFRCNQFDLTNYGMFSWLVFFPCFKYSFQFLKISLFTVSYFG